MKPEEAEMIMAQAEHDSDVAKYAKPEEEYNGIRR